MARLLSYIAALTLASLVVAECGAGSPHAVVDGRNGSFVTTAGNNEIYTGPDFYKAITTGLDSLKSGDRIAVMADGSIGDHSIFVGDGITFEGCGTIDASTTNYHGAIESTGTTDASIPYLTLTGNPVFGMLFYGTKNLNLGIINMQLSAGLGIRFNRDDAPSSNVTIHTLTVTGASSHAIETWNIDGLSIGAIYAKNVGECGLLLQKVTNVHVGLVDGDNCARGTGYATLRFANNAGELTEGDYSNNIVVDKVVSRGGGRGIFCVTRSGGATINSATISDSGNNAILIQNCYNLHIKSGSITGGGEVRIASSFKPDFPNNKDISISMKVTGTTIKESPCGERITWDLTGDVGKPTCG